VNAHTPGGEPSTGAAAIEFRGVRFGFTAEAVLDAIDLAVGQGEFVALLGPNGGGKTTLLKLALGLLRPQEGSISLFGEAVDRFRRWQDIGYVPQRTSGLDGGFPGTVAEVVGMGAYRGVDPLAFFRPSLTPAVAEALRLVDMWHTRHRPIGELSRGQQQRVLVARALVQPRRLLLLDEPTAGIDQAGQQGFYSLLRDLHRDHGLTIFLISHDVGVVLEEATRVACISRTLVFHGPPEHLTDEHLAQVYHAPVNRLTHDHPD
jgi:zinc transport system ATP-binding protein